MSSVEDGVASGAASGEDGPYLTAVGALAPCDTAAQQDTASDVLTLHQLGAQYELHLAQPDAARLLEAMFDDDTFWELYCVVTDLQEEDKRLGKGSAMADTPPPYSGTSQAMYAYLHYMLPLAVRMRAELAAP